MIKAIFAATESGGIGYHGTLPWPKNPEDLKWFKDHTSGQVVVMGRKTWDDPLMPKPLPNRINCVASNRPVNVPGVIVLSGEITENLLLLQGTYTDRDIYVIGGARLIVDCIDIFDEVYLTTVPGTWETDVNLDLNQLLSGFEEISKLLTRTNTYTVWRRKP